VSGLKDKKWIRKQTYTKTEAYKLYSRIFRIFLSNSININPYDFELYRFKVYAFFETQCMWLASLSSTSSYSEILQSTTTLSAGGKDQLSIQGFQYRCINCLELSVFNLHLLKVQNKRELFGSVRCCIRQSDISSAAGASDSDCRQIGIIVHACRYVRCRRSMSFATSY